MSPCWCRQLCLETYEDEPLEPTVAHRWRILLNHTRKELPYLATITETRWKNVRLVFHKRKLLHLQVEFCCMYRRLLHVPSYVYLEVFHPLLERIFNTICSCVANVYSCEQPSHILRTESLHLQRFCRRATQEQQGVGANEGRRRQMRRHISSCNQSILTIHTITTPGKPISKSTTHLCTMLHAHWQTCPQPRPRPSYQEEACCGGIRGNSRR
jgi:hypothetical protein